MDDELWFAYLLIFGAVLLIVQGVYRFYFRNRTTAKAVNRRLLLTQELASPTAVLEALRQERGIGQFDNPVLARISNFLAQTGLRIDRKLLVLSVVGLTVVFYLLSAIKLGLTWTSFLLGIAQAVAAVFLWLRRKRNRRIAQFAQQLPDALEVIVRGVRAGHPFALALGLVAKEMPDPIGTEFGMASDEISFGLDVRRAVENLYLRVGQEDLLFFIVTINVQTQTGGSLGEILSRLSQLIRERIKVRLKVRALTAEGRLSGIFLSALPFVLYGLINLIAPTYYQTVSDHPAFATGTWIGLALLAVGNLTMYRMVNFKY